jgi:hypothetical protein
MKQIQLTQGKFALVDEDMFEYLSRWKWRAQIMLNGRLIHLGYFTDPVEAAKAYDEAARKYHGEFASLNFD